MKKELDFHRLAHRRIKQENKEKDREIERLHTYYNGVIEENGELQTKYEITKRRGQEAKIARDQARTNVNARVLYGALFLHTTNPNRVVTILGPR